MAPAFPEQYPGSRAILFSHLADWRPGDDVIIPPAGSCGVAKERMDGKQVMTCHDWFFYNRKLDENKVLGTILKKVRLHPAPRVAERYTRAIGGDP